MKKIVPVLREENKHLFADDVRLCYNTDIDGASRTVVSTGFLKPDNVVDLIGLASPGWLVTDSDDEFVTLSPDVTLDAIAIKFGEDVIVLNFGELTSAKYQAPPAGEVQRLTLNITFGTRLLGGYSDEARESLSTLTELIDGSIDPAVHICVHSTVNIETGELHFTACLIPFEIIPGNNELNSKLAAGEIVGYTVKAYASEPDAAVCVDGEVAPE